MKNVDKIAQKRFLEKINLIRASGGSVDPNETKEQKLARIEKASKDYRFMVNYYFPHYATSDCADFHIEFANMVAKNKVFKGFAEWGRGLAKSVTTDILIPFWLHYLKKEPMYLVIIGNNEKKSIQLLADIRAELENNPRIIADFGEQKNLGSWEEGFFTTKSGFIGQALGIGQSVRGLRVQDKRPNYLVPDDVETKDTIKNEKRQDDVVEWMLYDLIPTMDGDIRRFLLSNNAAFPIMIGKKLQILNPSWKVHHIKAYDKVTYAPRWKEKYKPDYYRILEQEIGILPCLAEYNNEPHVRGKIFTEELIQWCKLPRLDHFEHIVAHWDVAYAGTATADYNSVRIWGLKDKQFYYITSFVKKTKMRAAIEFMADYQKELPNNVRVHWRFEAQFWNDEVERTIREVEEAFQIDLRMTKVDNPRIKKYDRIVSIHPYYQNGRVWWNEKMKSHSDTQVGKAQLLGIEPGYHGHDDAPDADEQCISFLSKHIYEKSKGGKPMTGRVERKHVY
jgi:phage terminase large subunit-like protein